MQLETLPHGLRKHAEAGNFIEPAAAIRRERQAKNARRAGVDRVDCAVAVEHDHARGQVVEDGLEVGARAFDLRHAFVDELARVGELLGHLGEGARQAAQLVARAEHRLRAEVTPRDLGHAFGQQEQRLRQLVAERDGEQQRAEHRQHQGQRERAYVHLAQTRSRQRTLLVFAIGARHGERIRSERRRDRLRDDQIAFLLAQREVAARNQRHGTHPRCGAGGSGVFIEPVGLTRDALGARLTQQRRRDALGHQARARRAARQQRLPRAADDRDLACRELLAQALECERLGRRGAVAETLGSEPRLGGKLGDDRVDRASAEVQAGVERAFHLDVEPALDRPRDELVAHGVDEQPGHHPDEREDRCELEQQSRAEAPARDVPEQSHRGHHDHQHQRARQRHVDPEQPHVVTLVERRVVGCDAEQEGQHHARAERRQGGDDPGPAAASRYAGRGPRAGRRRHRFYRALTGCAACASPAAASRVGRRCRSASAAAAASCRAGTRTRRNGGCLPRSARSRRSSSARCG